MGAPLLSTAAPGAPLVAFLTATEKPDDALVSPGIAGFLVTFALALATLFLIRSMVKHLRKVRYGPDPYEEESPRTRADGRAPGEGPGLSSAAQRGEVTQPRASPEGRDTE